MPETVKFNLRLPADLHAEAAELAKSSGLSLNAFVLLALRNWTDYQSGKRSQRATARPAPARRPQATAATPRPAPAKPAIEARTPASFPKVGRNDPCPCGSGLKFKRCHGGAPA